MELFTALFGKLLVFVYHCFDRIVIQGYLPLLVREEHMVHFFRDVQKIYPITKEALSKRTNEYKRWVEAFARKQGIPMEWAQKGVRKEDYVRPYLQRMQRQNRYGVYFILQSMERGYSFRSLMPKYPTDDPDYRLIRKRPARFTHLYFYIRDEVLVPMVMCVGTFLPFQPPLSDSQNLRARLRDGVVGIIRRQGGPDFRDTHHQKGERQGIQSTRQTRSWSPRAARLLQESRRPHV